ncbi:hypothetical protein F5Y19DRAFT_476356 [Xylariaceae sp. FL1651]|nr:hypothetical protein F5Y19DRAFT_476356 [Xylariaceae sp. FL1651]
MTTPATTTSNEVIEDNTPPPPPRALTPIQESESSDIETIQPKLSNAQSTNSCNITSFHSDADLKVIVQQPGGDITTTYMVCACAMACASPLWRSMLFYNTAQARGAEGEIKENLDQTLKLEGDAEAIGVLFRIIHYDFSHVPEEPTLDQLFELCLNACRFRCTHLFHPWANKWISSMSTFVSEAHCHPECHKALHIAWTFGDIDLFRDMIDALIVSTKIDAKGRIVNISGKPLDDMLLNLNVLPIITETRIATVAKILDAVKTPIESLSSTDRNPRSSYCKIGKDSKECEAMMLGSVLPALMKAGLFPVPEPHNFTGSLLELKYRLDEIKMLPYIGRDWVPHKAHDNCNLGFCESVTTCLKEMPVPLSDYIMSWMSEQAKICGIEAGDELAKYRQQVESLSREPIVHKADLPHELKKENGDDSDGASVVTIKKDNSEDKP